MQQNLVSGVRGLDPKQAGGEIKDHDKMTPTYCLCDAATTVTTYRTRANKGRSWIVAEPKKLAKIGAFYWI